MQFSFTFGLHLLLNDDDCFCYYKKWFRTLDRGSMRSICYFRFEIIGGLRSHLLLFFLERKNMIKQKSSQSKISSRLKAYSYTCVLCTHIRINICRQLIHLDSSGPPGVSSRPLPLHAWSRTHRKITRAFI